METIIRWTFVRFIIISIAWPVVVIATVHCTALLHMFVKTVQQWPLFHHEFHLNSPFIQDVLATRVNWPNTTISIATIMVDETHRRSAPFFTNVWDEWDNHRIGSSFDAKTNELTCESHSSSSRGSRTTDKAAWSCGVWKIKKTEQNGNERKNKNNFLFSSTGLFWSLLCRCNNTISMSVSPRLDAS